MRQQRRKNANMIPLFIMTLCSLVIFVVNLCFTSSLQEQATHLVQLRQTVRHNQGLQTPRMVHHRPTPRRPHPSPQVTAGDKIYYTNPYSWDSSPVVLEEYKLIFFTIPKVGCTVWKQLFRRMMGYTDYMSQEHGLPHNVARNGLKYLKDYSLQQATEMMTSDQWTRAIMVRDPKLRFLSAFLDKAVSNDHQHIRDRCCPDRSCVTAAQTIAGFVNLTKTCHDDHWQPQTQTMDAKWWPYITDVLHVESAAVDAKRLLQKIGAWNQYGANWHDDIPLFGSTETSGAGNHATWSQHKVWQWYTPATELLVEAQYRADYETTMLGFEHYTCLTCLE